MKLKPAILSVLGRDDLKGIIDDLEIDGVDRRSVDAMREKLARSRKVSAEDPLGYVEAIKAGKAMDRQGRPISVGE